MLTQTLPSKHLLLLPQCSPRRRPQAPQPKVSEIAIAIAIGSPSASAVIPTWPRLVPFFRPGRACAALSLLPSPNHSPIPPDCPVQERRFCRASGQHAALRCWHVAQSPLPVYPPLLICNPCCFFSTLVQWDALLEATAHRALSYLPFPSVWLLEPIPLSYMPSSDASVAFVTATV
jgi:hypothetical protein